MPVVTRSQIKSVSSLVKDSSALSKTPLSKTPLSTDNVKLIIHETKGPIFDWFLKIVKKYLKEIEILNIKKKTIVYAITEQDGLNTQNNISNTYKQYYYEQLRLITELFYIIQEYFPRFTKGLSFNSSQKFANNVFTKSHELFKEINYNKVVPITFEEIKMVNLALSQIRDTEKLLSSYLQNPPTENLIETYLKKLPKTKTKNRFPPVDYTGMDTVYADKFDGITNIWEDTTMIEDPNYEP